MTPMRLPHHSTVLSSLALFVALGGTGYAATKFPANSVTSREVKARSIHLSDLASDARPSAKSKLFRTAVTDVVLDPNTQAVVDSLAGAVKGEPGPKGDAGAAVQGPQGTEGAQGRPGEALGYGHMGRGGSLDEAGTSANITGERANTDLADGVYHFCIDAPVSARNLVATPDGDDPVAPQQPAPISVRVKPTNGVCAGRSFEVMTTRSFFFTVN